MPVDLVGIFWSILGDTLKDTIGARAADIIIVGLKAALGGFGIWWVA